MKRWLLQLFSHNLSLQIPRVVGDVVLLNKTETNQIYGFSFFIRGKPWHVTIDDMLLITTVNPKLVYAQPAKANTVFWVPLLEKAWAKVNGNYAGIDQPNFIENGLRALTGVPVLSYTIDSTYNSDAKIQEIFSLLSAAETS